MKKRKYESIVVDKIPDTAKQIKGSKDWADRDGNIYTVRSEHYGRIATRGKVIRKTQVTNQGYKYCEIYDLASQCGVTRRVHRVIAETFIPNPDNLPIVGHKNNIKTDNRVENLYWTTWSKNSQKAVDDGLLVNDKGINDSQSMPVAQYDTKTNKLLGVYGSITEAVHITGVPKTTIARQAKYHRPVRRDTYFRYIDDEAVCPNQIVGRFDYDTDELIDTFISVADAARKLNLCEKTIGQQVKKGKPKHKFSNQYFAYVGGKCEQTIERREGK